MIYVGDLKDLVQHLQNNAEIFVFVDGEQGYELVNAGVEISRYSGSVSTNTLRLSVKKRET